MKLSANILKAFAKEVSGNDKKEQTNVCYGTVASKSNGVVNVKLDGSELLTPVDSAMDAEVGDRVMVQIKNHNASITGNLTSPAVGLRKVISDSGNESLVLYQLAGAVGLRAEYIWRHYAMYAEAVCKTDGEYPIVAIQTREVDTFDNSTVGETTSIILSRDGIAMHVPTGKNVIINGSPVLTANSLFANGNVTANGTVGKSGSKKITIKVTVPTGYTLAGINKITTNHPYAVVISGFEIASDNTVNVWLANQTASDQVTTVYIKWFALKSNGTIYETEETVDF